MPESSSSQLTTALEAARSRSNISTNPIGASADLTRKSEPLPAIDFVATISDQLDALSEGVQTFEDTNGQPNTELLEINTEMSLLEAQLRELQVKRDEIRKRGTPKDRLYHAVVAAERTLIKTVSNYEVAVSEEILAERYGQAVSLSRLNRNERDELRRHKRVSDLQKFITHSSRETDTSVEALQRRADAAGERLVALRSHIAAEEQNGKKQ